MCSRDLNTDTTTRQHASGTIAGVVIGALLGVRLLLGALWLLKEKVSFDKIRENTANPHKPIRQSLPSWTVCLLLM